MLAASAAILVGISSCSSPQKLLCNTWKVKGVQFDSASGYNKQLQEAFTREIVKVKFVFNADSTYYVKTNTDSVAGTWLFNKADMTFTTNTAKTGSALAKIVKLSKTSLIYSTRDSGSGEITFNCIPLTKK